MNINSPLVSVIIPCYNQGKFLLEAVSSVRSQTYRNTEIIIVDDGSTIDPAEPILSALEEHSVSVKFYKHITNLGAAASRNTAIKHCHGELILPLDADDLLAVNHLEKTVDALNDSQYSCASTDMQLFGDISCVQKVCVSLLGALSGETLPICTLFKREVYDTIGGYKEHIGTAEDLDFGIRALAKGFKYAYVDEPLYFYRQYKSDNLSDYKNFSKDATKLILQEHRDILIQNLADVMLVKEDRYFAQLNQQRQEYTHLDKEFHKLLEYNQQKERLLSREIGVKEALNILLNSVRRYINKMAS
jgi:glycosyltransferase involved in cell wall biosynthesis